MLLLRAGVGVVAVDDPGGGENVGTAREMGHPVVIGRGADLWLLRRLALRGACALAAVTDDDLGDISVAMAALSVDQDLRVVLRVGDGRRANETRSLAKIGRFRDVHRTAAVLIAAHAVGAAAERVICHEDEAVLVGHGVPTGVVGARRGDVRLHAIATVQSAKRRLRAGRAYPTMRTGRLPRGSR